VSERASAVALGVFLIWTALYSGAAALLAGFGLGATAEVVFTAGFGITMFGAMFAGGVFLIREAFRD
jgi:hypothetical protein